VLALGLLAGNGLFGDDVKKEAPPAKETPVAPRVSLPTFYNRLGLSTDQKKQILRTRADYAAKVADLKNQIKALQDKESREVQKVLTPAQKDRLREILLERAPKETRPGDLKRTTQDK
jgi:hypothetical protein